MPYNSGKSWADYNFQHLRALYRILVFAVLVTQLAVNSRFIATSSVAYNKFNKASDIALTHAISDAFFVTVSGSAQ